MYGDEARDKTSIRKLLKNFASRAYREPVSDGEIDRYAKLVFSLLGDTQPKFSGNIRDLSFKAYQGKWGKLPDFDKLKPFKQGTLRAGWWTSGLQGCRNSTASFTGKLEASEKGEYEFEIASDDGCRVLVGEKKVVEHDGSA